MSSLDPEYTISSAPSMPTSDSTSSFQSDSTTSSFPSYGANPVDPRILAARVHDDLSTSYSRAHDIVFFLIRAHWLPLFLLVTTHYSIALAMHNFPIDIFPVGYFKYNYSAQELRFLYVNTTAILLLLATVQLFNKIFLAVNNIHRARSSQVKNHYLLLFPLILIQEIGLYFSFTSQIPPVMSILVNITSALSIEIDTVLFLSACWLVAEKVFIIMGKTGVPISTIDLSERARLARESVFRGEAKEEIIEEKASLYPPSSIRAKVE